MKRKVVSKSSITRYLRELRGRDCKLGGANGTKGEEGKERGKKECCKHFSSLTCQKSHTAKQIEERVEKKR